MHWALNLKHTITLEKLCSALHWLAVNHQDQRMANAIGLHLNDDGMHCQHTVWGNNFLITLAMVGVFIEIILFNCEI